MSPIWRFYLDQNRQWRWQHIALNQDVVAQSPDGFNEWEHCVASAAAHGYIFVPPQPSAGYGAATSEPEMAS